MNNESVLILGGGIMQLPAIREAREMGFRVIVADVNPDAPGITLADRFLNIDLKDYHSMAAEAVSLRKDSGLVAVFTAGTDFSSTVAYAAASAGLPGIDYSTALTASNKILMRRAFRDAGVPSPSFYPVKNTVEALEAGMKLDFPVVIKPVDSMGARGVIKIEDANDKTAIDSAVTDAVKVSRTSEAIIEEYIDGPEFSLDAVVSDGDITICGFADRHIYFPPYFVEMGHTMPTVFPDKVKSAVIDVFMAGIRAIGIDNGAAKGDIKYSEKKGAMAGEIAARLSGGFMSGWTFPYSSGVNLTRAALNVAAGRPPGDLFPKFSRVSAERAVISIPGIVESIYGTEEAGGMRHIKDIFLNTAPRKRVYFPVNNVQKCANVISAAEDHTDAVNAAENAVRQIFIRLKPGDRETDDFLSGKGWDWVPDAFNPDNPESKDWHGLGIDAAIEKVRSVTGCHGNEMTPRFWKCFTRGGVQGGVWQIETAREGGPS